MKYGSLSYRGSNNLGDEIQTLAAERFLPRVDVRIDRDRLADFSADEPHIVIMQGWFASNPLRAFPPAPAIRPVFVGFHIADREDVVSHLLSSESLEDLKLHQPIGCRDEHTRELLASHGVDAFTTHCLTLTFSRRPDRPIDGRVFIVDGDRLWIPRHLRRGAEIVRHEAPAVLGDDIRRAMANRLLEVYREEAGIVITTRLHCALPCIAMGVPVVFFGDPKDPRLGILHDIGLPIYRRQPRSRFLAAMFRLPPLRGLWHRWTVRSVDWEPAPLNVDAVRRRLIETTADAISRSESSSHSTQTVP